jgi:hypothetical protein
MKLLNSILAVILFALSAAAQAEASSKQVENAAKLLADDFRPYVVTLERDIKVYHYLKNTSLDQDLPLESGVFDHQLLRGLNYFWASTSNEAVYAAHDPASSRSYGNILLEITIKMGSHVLAGHSNNVRLSGATVDAIREVDSYYNPDYFRFDSVMEHIPKPVLASALRSLDVEAATYLWGAAEMDAVCSNVSSTFLLLGTPTNLDLAASGDGVIAKNMTVEGFTPSASDFADPAKRGAYARIERFLKLSSTQPLNLAISSSNIGTMSDSEKNTWRDQIFTCDSLHPLDDPH